MNLGPWEIGGIVVIAFLLFGPKRLPELARSLGEGVREFKKSLAPGAGEAAEKKADGEQPRT